MKPASPGLMHETGCSGLVYWDVPGGWDGEGSGREGQMGNTCTPMADSWVNGKNHHNIVK